MVEHQTVAHDADAFVATLKDALRQIPMAVPYYPGVQKRHAKFAEHYGDRAERIGESLSPGAAVPSTRELAAGRRSLRQAPALVAKKTKRPPPLVAKRASAASKR